MQINLFPQSVCWCQNLADGVRLHIYVQPNAKVTGAAGEFHGALKLRLKAPPVDGKANKVLCAWLAKRLGVSNHAVYLETGHTHRYKQVRITATGLDEEAVHKALSDGV